jgi:galactokinase
MAWSMREAGLPILGFEGTITSDLPIGAGLSSSAALELAAGWALSGPDGPQRPPMSMARLAQRAENEHVGVRCGLMDQFASACGVAGHALLLDCRSLEWRPVPLPGDLALVIAHSGVPRSLGTSAYNERRADCERAVAAAATHDPGVTALRDVDLVLLDAIRAEVEPRVFDRAHHVITENARVADAITALEADDALALGELFAASHASLRDRFDVSCPELDVLVDIAVSTPGVVASRMTGAGFGGCTINLVRPDAVAAVRARIEAEYPGRSGRASRTWEVRASDGAGFVAGRTPRSAEPGTGHPGYQILRGSSGDRS